MRSIHLRKDIASIDEENLILVGALLIEKPKGSWQRNRREHITWQGNHLTDDAILYHLLADFQLRATCITRRISHDESSLAILVQSRGKVTYPQIVGIRHGFLLIRSLLGRFGLVARHTIGIESGIICHLLKHHFIHIERRICHHIVETPKGIVRVAIERISLGYLASHIVEQEVHLGKLHGIRLFLHTITAEAHQVLVAGIVAMHIASRLHKHTARATSWVQELLISRNWAKHLYHILHHGGWRIEGSSTLTFRQSKVAKEVFVYLTEDVDADVLRNILEYPDDAAQQLWLLLWHQLPIHLFGQHPLHTRVLLFDSLHGTLHQQSLVGIIGRIVDKIEVSTFGEEEATLLHGYILVFSLHTRTFILVVLRIYLSLMLLEEHIGIAEEDETENRLTIFVSRQVGTSTQHISRVPKIVFEILEF